MWPFLAPRLIWMVLHGGAADLSIQIVLAIMLETVVGQLGVCPILPAPV